MTTPLEDRLLDEVDRTPGHGPGGDCWLWTGQTTNGYGKTRVDRRWKRVHRLLHELFNGPIPDGHEIRHTCHVRRCVNPAHLLTGTRQDNINDMVEAGRQAKGENHGRSKVSDHDREWIRWLYANGCATKARLARAFGLANVAHLVPTRRRHTKSPYGPGVYRTRQGDRYRATTGSTHIGTFDTPEEAQQARAAFLRKAS